MLENLLAFGLEETANLLDASVLLEELCVLKLGTMGWVVSHEILSKENTGVEPVTDARVDFVCQKGVVLEGWEQLLTLTLFINQTIDLS